MNAGEEKPVEGIPRRVNKGEPREGSRHAGKTPEGYDILAAKRDSIHLPSRKLGEESKISQLSSHAPKASEHSDSLMVRGPTTIDQDITTSQPLNTPGPLPSAHLEPIPITEPLPSHIRDVKLIDLI